MEKQKIKFLCSVLCFFLSSGAVFLIPFSDISGRRGSPALGYTAGIIFWFFLIAGMITQIMLYKGQKKSHVETDYIINPLRLIFGILFVISLIMVIICIYFIRGVWINTLFIFLCLFSFEAALIFSDKKYNLYFNHNGGSKK